MMPSFITITRNEAEELFDAARVRSSCLKLDDDELLLFMELSGNRTLLFKFDRKKWVKSYHVLNGEL